MDVFSITNVFPLSSCHFAAFEPCQVTTIRYSEYKIVQDISIHITAYQAIYPAESMKFSLLHAATFAAVKVLQQLSIRPSFIQLYQHIHATNTSLEPSHRQIEVSLTVGGYVLDARAVRNYRSVSSCRNFRAEMPIMIGKLFGRSA